MPKEKPLSFYPLDFDTAMRALVHIPKEAVIKSDRKKKRKRAKSVTRGARK